MTDGRKNLVGQVVQLERGVVTVLERLSSWLRAWKSAADEALELEDDAESLPLLAQLRDLRKQTRNLDKLAKNYLATQKVVSKEDLARVEVAIGRVNDVGTQTWIKARPTASKACQTERRVGSPVTLAEPELTPLRTRNTNAKHLSELTLRSNNQVKHSIEPTPEESKEEPSERQSQSFNSSYDPPGVEVILIENGEEGQDDDEVVFGMEENITNGVDIENGNGLEDDEEDEYDDDDDVLDGDEELEDPANQDIEAMDVSDITNGDSDSITPNTPNGVPLAVKLKLDDPNRDPRICPFPSCGKKFANRSKVNLHIRVHTGEQPFICAHCGRGFSLDCNLKRHLLAVHAGQRPFPCEECNYSFTQKQSLERHIRSVHGQERPHKCPQCPRAFSQKQSMRAHLMSAHIKSSNTSNASQDDDRPFVCPHCRHNFKTGLELKNHVRARHRAGIVPMRPSSQMRAA